MLYIWPIVVAAIGAAVGLTGGLVGFLVLPNVVEDQIIESVKLVDGSEAFERWETLPLPVVYKLYFFNVTNPDDVQDGAQPIVTEIGPYVYNQYRTKTNITREDDILSYYQHMLFEFDEEASAPLSNYDEITIVNLPLLSIVTGADYVLSGSSFSMTALNSAIPTLFGDPTSVFLTTTPQDFLFDGVYVMCNTTNFLYSLVCTNLEAQASETMPRLEDGRFRFSLFGHKNDSDDGHYSINDGTIDVSQLGEIVAWENSSTLGIWTENSTCDDIVGCDASLFAPFVTTESIINIFSTDICRSVNVEYSEETVYSGINGLRFTLNENVLKSPSNYSENECFCLNRTEGVTGDDGCLLDGAMELWDCVGGPVVLSLPHFYQANEEYQNGVEGTSPNESLHGMFLDVEPLSGTLLRGYKRVQFNIFLKPVDRITLTTNLPTVLMPVVWVDEGIELTDELIDQLNQELFGPLKLVSYVTWGTIIGGSILFAGGLIWLITLIIKSSATV